MWQGCHTITGYAQHLNMKTTGLLSIIYTLLSIGALLEGKKGEHWRELY